MKDGVKDEVASGSVPSVAEAAPLDARGASGGIRIQCQFCIGRNFRRSRLRQIDLKQLLMMRYPVRCLRCSQRQMVSFSVAGISVPSHAKHVPERPAAAAETTAASVADRAKP